MNEIKEKEVKFTESELEQIKGFQKRYVEIQMGFGQAEITRSRIETQFEALDTFHDELRENLSKVQEEERAFIDDINKKYGDGVLNPETGVFTPNQQNPIENN